LDLYENFTGVVSVDREELVEFWRSSVSGFGWRNLFEEFFSVVR